MNKRGRIRRNDVSAKRERLLAAINAAAVAFISCNEDTLDEVMVNALRPVARVAELDRICVFKHVERENIPYVHEVFRWDEAEGGGTDIRMAELDELPYEGNIPRWQQVLPKGENIHSTYSDLPPDEKRFFKKYNVKTLLVIPVFVENSFWGFTLLLDMRHENYFGEACIPVLRSLSFLLANTIIRFDSGKYTVGVIASLQRRDELLNTLNSVAVSFVSQTEDTFEGVLDKGIQRIADVSGLDRVSLYYFLEGKKGHARQFYRWDRASGGLSITPDYMIDVDYGRYVPRLLSIIESGKCIHGLLSEFEPDEAAFCARFGMKSVVFAPIMLHGKLWGFASFHDNTNEREFDSETVNMLYTAAYLCGGTRWNNDMMKAVLDSSESLKRHDALMGALNTMASALIGRLNESFDSAFSAAYIPIATMTGVDRILIYRGSCVDNDQRYTNIYRWVTATGKTEPVPSSLINISFKDTAPLLDEKLRRGGGYNVSVADMNEEEHALFSAYGVTAALTVPIVRDDEFWGFVLFEKLIESEKFDDVCAEALMSAAFLTAGTFIRRELEHENAEQSQALSEQLKRQELLADITRGFVSGGEAGQSVTKALMKLGRFENAQRVVVVALDEKNHITRLKYHWYEDGAPPLPSDTFELYDLVCGSFPHEIPIGAEEIPSIVCFNAASSEDARLRELGGVGIVAFIWTGVYVEGVLWGVLAVERCDHEYCWSDNDARMVSMVSSAFSGAVARDIYDQQRSAALAAAVAARQEAAAAETIANNILAGIPLGVLFVDEEGHIIDCNDEIMRMLGVTDRRLVLESYAEKLSPKYQPGGGDTARLLREIAARAIAGERVVTEWTHLSASGEEIPCESTITRLEYGDRTIAIGYSYDLRGLKRVQEALAEAEARAQAILGGSPIGCIIMDAEANIIDCNEGMLNMLNIKDKQLFVNDYPRYSPPLQPDGSPSASTIKEKAALAAKGERLAYEWLFIDEDGFEVPVAKTVTRVEYGTQSIIISYNYDLRGIKRMEREIAEAEERSKAMMEASPLACTMIDSNMRVVDCNEALIRNYDGLDKQYYLEHFYELSPEFQPDGKHSAQYSKELLNRALNGEAVEFEWVHRKPSGELMPTAVTLVPVKYKGETFVMGYHYDLRSIKKMQDEILERDEHLQSRLEQQKLVSEVMQSFLSSTTKLSVLMDSVLMRVGTYMGVSRALVVMLNVANGDVIIPYHWFSDSESRVPLRAGNGHIALAEFPVDVPENRIIPMLACDDALSPDYIRLSEMSQVGARAFLWRPLYVFDRLWGLLTVEMCSAPRKWHPDESQLLDAVGASIAGVIMRDIQSRERDAALDKAIVAGQAKNAFLANMSHEMRTPMNAIIGMTMAGKNSSSNERKDYALDKIEEASAQLLGVINDVLDMSKIESNRLELTDANFNFYGMMNRLSAAAGAQAGEKGLTLSARIDPAIPPELFGDEQRLAQVVSNLLSNAIKFTPEGGLVTLVATLLCETDGYCELRVEVSDTGIGVSLGQQSALFSAFQQAESAAARKFGGTGLGLAIAKRIVELMGGHIWVESELGSGATFIFTAKLPRGVAPKAAPAPRARCSEFMGVRILLVEDVEINREIVLALFEETGLAIDCCSGGAEAVKMFASSPDIYDMVFMDTIMPEMNGFDAAIALRATDNEWAKRVPIIAMAGSVFEEDIAGCREAGMNDCVGKPLDVDEVSEKINKYRREPQALSDS